VLTRTAFQLGSKSCIWKQVRGIVIMSESKSLGALGLLSDEATQGFIPLGLMQTSLCCHLCQKPHGRHIKDERKRA
jgi:hypothetical protein